MKPQFIVSIAAPDGVHRKRFYGLDAKAANRAIAYASLQLGRPICRDVDDHWLSEVGCLSVGAVCNYGRVIRIEQVVNSSGPWLSPGPVVAPAVSRDERHEYVDSMERNGRDPDYERNEWNGIGPDVLPDSDFWLTPEQRRSRDIQELRAKGYCDESISEILSARAADAAMERGYSDKCGGDE
jgi:hypothetical protein